MLERIHKGGVTPEQCIRDAKDKTIRFRLFGFGHRVYNNYDPRAKILRDACDKVLATMKRNDPLLDIARKLEELALKDPYFVERKLYPERRFLQRHLAALHGDSHRNVHGLLRDRPAARLDRPVEGTARRPQQPHLAAPADLYRSDHPELHPRGPAVRRPSRSQCGAATPGGNHREITTLRPLRRAAGNSLPDTERVWHCLLASSGAAATTANK